MNFGLINDETTSEMSYGRIVALIAFAGLVAVYAVKNDTRQHITPMMMYTSKFIERRILMTWDRGDCGSEKRSWVGLLSQLLKDSITVLAVTQFLQQYLVSFRLNSLNLPE